MAAASPFRGALSHVTALAVRTVRAEENRWITHALRGLVCVVILMFLYLAVSGIGTNDAPGLAVFATLIGVDCVAVGLGAITFFPSTITEEKEARTLGLLRMADVGPAALLIGKVLPRLAVIVLLLLVQLPLTLLAVTLGGVSWEQVLLAYWVLGISTVTVAALGSLLSVLCSTTRQACSSMVGLGFLTVIATAVFFALVGYFFGNPATRWLGELLERWVWPALPLAPLTGIVSSGWVGATGGGTPFFGYFFWANVVVSAVLFGLAWVAFDRSSVDPGEATEPRPVGMRLKRLARIKSGDGAAGRSSRRAWKAALAWKDWWFVGGGKVGLMIRVTAYVLGSYVISGLSSRPRFQPTMEEFGATLALISGVCFLVELAVISARLFRSELDNHTWSSLVLLPQSMGWTVLSKAAGGLLTTVPSVVCFLFGIVWVDNGYVFNGFLDDVADEPEVLVGFVYFGLLVVSCSLMIVYLSLKMRYGMIPLTAVIMGFGHGAAGFVLTVLALGGSTFSSGIGVGVLGCLVLTILSFVLVELSRDKLGELAAYEG